MVIDAVKFYGHAVDQQRIILRNTDLPQTRFQPDDLAASLQNNRVKEWLFRIPQNGVFRAEHKFVLHIFFCQHGFSGQYLYIGSAFQTDFDLLVIREHLHIADVVFRPLQDVNIPENAVIAEEILILQIASAAPLKYLCPDGVFPLTDKVRNIKLCLQVAALGKAHISAIYIQIGTGGHALKDKVNLSPLLPEHKFPLINATGIVIGHIGGITGIGIVDIGIIGVFIAMKLPARRHRDGIPSADHFRRIHIPAVKGKAPLAV